MAANGKINSALCPNNWVRKLHGNRNARCHFCMSYDVAAAQVCEKCSLCSQMVSVMCGKVVEI